MGFQRNIALAMAAGAVGLTGAIAVQAGPAEDWQRAHADLAKLQGPWTGKTYRDEYTIDGDSVILTRKGPNTNRPDTPDRFAVMTNLRYSHSAGDAYHYFKGNCNLPAIPGQRGIVSHPRELMVTANVDRTGGKLDGYSSITATCVEQSERPVVNLGRSSAAPAMRPTASPVMRQQAPVAATLPAPAPASIPVTSAQELAEIATRERLNSEQAAFAARQVAENQAAKDAFDKATRDRAATIAAQDAEYQRSQREYEAAMAKWRADVAACEAGEFSRCAQP